MNDFERANNVWHQQYKNLKCIDRSVFNTIEKKIIVAVNSHKMFELSIISIFQYDVNHNSKYLSSVLLMRLIQIIIENEIENRDLIKIVWQSKTIACQKNNHCWHRKMYYSVFWIRMKNLYFYIYIYIYFQKRNETKFHKINCRLCISYFELKRFNWLNDKHHKIEKHRFSDWRQRLRFRRIIKNFDRNIIHRWTNRQIMNKSSRCSFNTTNKICHEIFDHI